LLYKYPTVPWVSLLLLQYYVSCKGLLISLAVGFIVSPFFNSVRHGPLTANSLLWEHHPKIKDYKHRNLHGVSLLHYLWKVILKGKLMWIWAGAHLPKDLSKTPVLYMYGSRQE
jgi:hypothetical protein